MLVILDRATRAVHAFPEASETCQSVGCPAGAQCTAGGPTWLCVLALRDGAPVCLASFAEALAVMGCACPAAACPHLDPEHPALLPLLERCAELVEPEDEKIRRYRDQTRARLLGHPPAAAAAATPGHQIVARIHAHAPHALDNMDLRRRG